MIYNYIKIAYRNLLKNKIFTVINVAGLAIGISVALLIAIWVYDEYSYDRFHKNRDNIYRITEIQQQEDGSHPTAMTPGPLAESLQKDYPEVEQTLRVGLQSGLFQNGERLLQCYNVLAIDPTFFSVFDFELNKGDRANVFNAPEEVILTENSAATLFGNDWATKDIIGKSITLKTFQELTLTVKGIAKNLPSNSHIQGEIFVPLKLLEKYDEWSMKWGGNNFHTYLKLHPNTIVKDFENKFTSSLKKYNNDEDTKLFLQPLSSIYLKSKFDFQTDWGKRSDIFYSYLFITVGFIIILIAIFNYVNLTTAQATQRGKEVGVRKMTGAGKSNLIAQFFTESSLLVFITICLSLIIANQSIPLLNQLSGKELVLPFFEKKFWYSIVIFSLVIIIATGIYPAFILSSYAPAKVLKGMIANNSGKNFRKSMVIIQFTLSTILIVASITIYNQLNFMQNKNLGFNKDNLFYIRLSGDLKDKSSIFKNEILKIPSIKSAAVTTSNLVDVSNSSNIEWQGQSTQANFLVTQLNTDPDFLETIGGKIVSGRNFSKDIPSDTSDVLGTYLLNETAVRRMGWDLKTAIGKKVKFWGFEGLVVGVVKDFHFRPLNIQIEPFIFRYRPKESYFNLLVKTDLNTLQQSLKEITKVYKNLEPLHPLSYGFVNQDLEKLYANDQRTGKLIFIFSCLAILISCMGLFGLVTFTTQRRFKEIGIRKILGDSIIGIASLLSKEFVKLVLIAFVIAFPIAYLLMNKWLQNFAYKIDIGWESPILSGLFLILVSIFAVSFQAIKAALMNPVKSLKSE